MIDILKDKIRTQIIEVLKTQYQNQKTPFRFVLDKSVLTSCPIGEDVREVADTEFRKRLVYMGFQYEYSKSNCNEMHMLKYMVCPVDYSKFRKYTKAQLSYLLGRGDYIDGNFILYYDETNNVKKFLLKEGKNKFNVSPDTIFVLGGVEANSGISFADLRDTLALQSNVKEIKSYNVYDGQLPDCLKSNKLEIVLDLLISKGWHIHFQSLNLLYWSIVDILDSIDGFSMQPPEIVNGLKAMLYRIMKSDVHFFYNFVLRYKYPGLKSEEIGLFYNDIADKCRLYQPDSTYLLNLKMLLIEWLCKASKQQEAVFIQEEPELILLQDLAYLYCCEVSSWINSRIIFDNEIDVIYEMSRFPVCVDGQIMDNYHFVESTTDAMVQLSDVIVGIVARYLSFIEKEAYNLANYVDANFNEKQLRIFCKLNKLLKMSRDYNPAFIHQTTSIEYHGLLNQYIDKYSV